jgi:hypothetical protein
MFCIVSFRQCAKKSHLNCCISAVRITYKKTLEKIYTFDAGCRKPKLSEIFWLLDHQFGYQMN